MQVIKKQLKLLIKVCGAGFNFGPYGKFCLFRIFRTCNFRLYREDQWPAKYYSSFFLSTIAGYPGKAKTLFNITGPD
jgi:hypothetical protein